MYAPGPAPAVAGYNMDPVGYMSEPVVDTAASSRLYTADGLSQAQAGRPPHSQASTAGWGGMAGVPATPMPQHVAPQHAAAQWPQQQQAGHACILAAAAAGGACVQPPAGPMQQPVVAGPTMTTLDTPMGEASLHGGGMGDALGKAITCIKSIADYTPRRELVGKIFLWVSLLTRPAARGAEARQVLDEVCAMQDLGGHGFDILGLLCRINELLHEAIASQQA